MSKAISPKAQDMWLKVKAALLIYQPFFATILLEHMIVKIGKFPGIPTAGTNDRIMWVDEDFLASLTIQQAVGLFVHEIGHAMFLHMARARRYMDLGLDGNKFIPGLWNVSCDYIINALIVATKAGELPPGGFLDSRFDPTMSAETVYRTLYKEIPPKPRGGGGQGKGEGQGSGSGDKDGDSKCRQPEGSDYGVPNREGHDGKSPLDTHVYEVGTTSDTEMKRIVQSAAERAKAMGKFPSELERFVGELMTPKISWKEKLRKLIVNATARDSTTWKSPHRRRLISQGVYFPSYTGFRAGIVGTGHDTSGSMLSKAIGQGISETAQILTDCRPEKIYVLACDADVHDVTEYGPDDDIASNMPKMTGGGGTSFVPVFDWFEENNVEPTVLIYFTDMYGQFPKEPPDYPVIWVTDTKDRPAPFGETIVIDLDNE